MAWLFTKHVLVCGGDVRSSSDKIEQYVGGSGRWESLSHLMKDIHDVHCSVGCDPGVAVTDGGQTCLIAALLRKLKKTVQ
jgi:hypothetical protein